MTLIFLIFISISARANHSYDEEIKSHISALNKLSGLSVQYTSDCDLAEPWGESLSGVTTLKICAPVLDYFKTENSLDALLLIVSHEYAHALIDYDMSPEATTIWKSSINELADSVLTKLNNDQIVKLDSLRTNPEQSQIDLIKRVFQFAIHENTDSLAVKLLIMTNRKINLDTMNIFARYFNSPSFDRVADMRTKVIEVAETDGLESWSNFRCIGKGLNLNGSNQNLKKMLNESLIKDFEKECDIEEVFETFSRTLNDL